MLAIIQKIWVPIRRMVSTTPLDYVLLIHGIVWGFILKIEEGEDDEETSEIGIIIFNLILNVFWIA